MKITGIKNLFMRVERQNWHWVEVEKGWAELPDRPGLGIELNKAEIAKHPYGARDYSAAYYMDGSVADI